MKCVKCNRELPTGWKHKECDRCRQKKAQGVKNVCKAVGGLAIAIGSVIIPKLKK